MAGALLLFAHLFFPPGDLIVAQNGDCEPLHIIESAINWLDRATFLYPNVYSGYLKIERSELAFFEEKWNPRAWELLTTNFLALEVHPSSGISRLAGPLTECGMIFSIREFRLIDPDQPAIRGFLDLDGSLIPTEVFSFHAEGAFFR